MPKMFVDSACPWCGCLMRFYYPVVGNPQTYKQARSISFSRDGSTWYCYANPRFSHERMPKFHVGQEVHIKINDPVDDVDFAWFNGRTGRVESMFYENGEVTYRVNVPVGHPTNATDFYLLHFAENELY